MTSLVELHDRQRLCGAARARFMPSAHEEWRWTEGGAVLEWLDGTTICFAEELALIFRRLEPRCTADFRSVVYVLAACRGKLPDAGRIGALPEGDHRRIHLLLAKLKLLRDTDAALLRSAEARAELLEMILPPADGTTPEVVSGAELFTVWREDAATEELSFSPAKFDLRPLYALYAGLNEYTEERLRLRLRTGLDELPAPAELPEVPPASIRSLLEELKDDPELGGMARLAREIMAALKVPRALATPEDLPVGGWSDISNRGTPDRLLLSELAQDPLMLSVRVAQNEALYLRREPPARREEPPAALLIDIGLRLWGVPRVFAASVALAIAASRESQQESVRRPAQCWLTHPAGMQPCALRTREDLVGLLEQMHPGLDPLPALREFVRLIQDHPGRSAEPFFITHRDHLEDETFRAALRTDGLPAFFLATVDGAGSFALHHWEPQRGLKLLSHAALDLTRLVAAPRPLRKPGHLPAFLLQRPEPLSIPPRGEVLFSVTASDAAGAFNFAAMSDGSILRWKGYHCVMVVRKRPPGRVIHMHPMGLHEVAVVLVQDHTRNTPDVLIVRDHEAEIVRLEKLPDWTSVTSHGEYLYFLGRRLGISARSVLTGAVAGSAKSVPYSDAPYPGGIIGLPGARFAALGSDGHELKLSPLPALPEGKVAAAAWRSAPAGTVEALSRDGIHYCLSDSHWIQRWNSGSPVVGSVFQVSTEGLCLQDRHGGERDKVAFYWFGRSVLRRVALLERRLSSLSSFELPRRNRRSKISRVGALRTGELFLATPDGQAISFRFSERKCRVEATKTTPPGMSWIDFKPLAHPELNLQEAVFPGGRAVLDRRGFLHLQAWHGNHPEITLPLDDGFSAPWSSASEAGEEGLPAGALESIVREMFAGGGS